MKTALLAALASAWVVGAACSYSPASPPEGAGAAWADYEGSTGSKDAEINSDLDGEEDTEDPSKPECGPESIVLEDGTCIPSCVEVGAWCADDGDGSECTGYPPVESHDCLVCCAIPEDEQPGCPPGGCDEPGCPPGEDCTYTDACPDATCDVAGGEDCSTCPIDCGECPAVCGDAICSDGFETCSNCSEDCSPCPVNCGDKVCALGEAPDGENCDNCEEDCGKCTKVMTWDIAAGLNKGKGKVKSTLESIGRVIKNEKVDYVGLQSVDSKTKRSDGLDQSLYIAKFAKMYKRFGGAFKYNGGQYGVGFLSKHKIVDMAKTPMDTSDEWAKRRILLTASLDLQDYYVFFHLGVTALAKAPNPRLKQATTIAADLGFEPEAILLGSLNDVPDSPPLDKLQTTGSLLDLWLDYGGGTPGFTSKGKRVDYVMAAYNWWDPSKGGACAFVVRMYVKPSKGLSSHRPVVALLQRGLDGGDCGEATQGSDAADIGFGDTPCASDAECTVDPFFPFCVGGYCKECKTNANCDVDAPTCDKGQCI